jgi:hypothetical protein
VCPATHGLRGWWGGGEDEAEGMCSIGCRCCTKGKVEDKRSECGGLAWRHVGGALCVQDHRCQTAMCARWKVHRQLLGMLEMEGAEEVEGGAIQHLR